MSTLGELVVLHALKHPKFDIYHAQLALESLGVWDAEVLEGVEFLEHGDTAVAYEPPVRVIVLPVEEE